MMKVRVDVRTAILYVTKSGFTEVQIVPAVHVPKYIYIYSRWYKRIQSYIYILYR